MVNNPAVAQKVLEGAVKLSASSYTCFLNHISNESGGICSPKICWNQYII